MMQTPKSKKLKNIYKKERKTENNKRKGKNGQTKNEKKNYKLWDHVRVETFPGDISTLFSLLLELPQAVELQTPEDSETRNWNLPQVI